MWFPYIMPRRRPCGEILGISVNGPVFCAEPTRRRWRDGRHFRPICIDCNSGDLE